jgi:uncharacterized integral membrane protein
MALFRLVVWLLLLAGLAALAVQNTVLVSLVILGQQTISLPLWTWLVGALGLGALTNIFLSGLIHWTAFWTRRHERKVMRSVGASGPADSRGWGSSFGRNSEPTVPPTDTAAPKPGSQRSAYQPPAPPKEVVDADFRVIRPPSRSLEDES